MPINHSPFTIHNSQFNNPATLWAHTIVQSLATAGLTDVCLAPGSRSTPLTLAFAAHPEIAVHLQLDERSAGFMALGLAQAAGRPVALLCTSGTAAANFLPAVIEAFMSQVPLLVLTADRPPELRHSGANQTIDQVKLFGDHVLWAVDLDTPTAGMPEIALRNAAATAARAFALAGGLRPGPVHLNVPFRKPLEPAGTGGQEAVIGERKSTPTQDSGLRTQDFQLGSLEPSPTQLETLTGWLRTYERGLIVCGPGCPRGEFAAAVSELARRAGCALAADPLSGLRFGGHAGDAPLLAGYETLLAGGRRPPWEPPEIVIRFGQVPTGKWLNQYLTEIDPAVRLHVRGSGVWADDAHLTTHFWQVDELALARCASRELSAVSDQLTADSWLHQVLASEEALWSRLAAGLEYKEFDGGLVYDLFDWLPDGSSLVVGNSLPVRHVDQFGQPTEKDIRVYGNRGASGIDGVVSTAVGVALAEPERPVVLLIGDVSFFHDQNGLLAARKTANLKILLLNNNGGGIFRRLPVAAYDPPFTELFITPHDLDFEPIVRMHGLSFGRTHTRAACRDAFTAALAHPGPAVVEYVSDSAADEKLRQLLAVSR